MIRRTKKKSKKFPSTALIVRPMVALQPPLPEDQGKRALLEELAQLQAENAALKKLSMRVSQKGGLSVYGLGRYPVTLYRSQWTRLLAHADEIQSFLAEHAEELSELPPPRLQEKGDVEK